MSMISFPIATGSNEHPSANVNNQKRINVFPSPSGDFGRGDSNVKNYVLLPTAGLYLSATPATLGPGRAIVNINDSLYCVIENTVYTLSINTGTLTGTLTSIGTLTGDSSIPLCHANNRSQIMLVNGLANWGYIINYSSNTVNQITDPDFTGGETVVALDSYFFYNAPDTQAMYASAINDGTDYNALDTASAESRADNLVALLDDKGELLAFGKDTIEVWYDAGNPTGFPFSRREGEYYNLGLSAKKSAINIDNTVFFLDSRRYLTRFTAETGLDASITPPHIRAQFNSYSDVSDAYCYSLEDSGQLMIVVNFPTADKTWVYDLTTELWHERAYFNPGGTFGRHRAGCCVKWKQYHVALDHETGEVYIFRQDARTDNGQTIKRVFSSPHLHQFDNFSSVNSIYLYGEFGTGLTSGQGSDPQIMMQYSGNGGHTWSNEMWRSLGELGNYNQRVNWYSVGTERSWQFEFTISDAIDFSIVEFGIDLEVNNA